MEELHSGEVEIEGDELPDEEPLDWDPAEEAEDHASLSSLLETRRWLAGNQMTIADFAAAAQLSCLDYVGDVDWARNEGLHNWYAKIKSRPAFRSILADLVPGFTPPAHYADLDF